MSDAMTVFDRSLVRRRRDRAARGLTAHDFLFREVAKRLEDRLDDMRRTFARALDLGCRGGEMSALLRARGIERVTACDLSPAMARLALERTGAPAVAADEEALPFREGAFDLIISPLSLHWVNDLPGTLVQMRRSLMPDGLMLAAMLGGETLRELRDAMAEAEIELEGGLSPRVSPFADVRDAGGLLQRAGFTLPVVDLDTITVTYPDPFALMADLRGMGETNAVLERRRAPLRRATLMTAARRYAEAHAGEDGRIPATFQVLMLTAWSPGPGQQKPLRPGSGRVSLEQALESRPTPGPIPD